MTQTAALSKSADPAAPRVPARWAVAAVATLVMSVSYIDRQTLAVLAPTVTKALALSKEEYGWVLSAFSLAYLVGAPLAGAVLDRAGARKGLVLAVIAWSAAAACHALVGSFAILVAMRIVLGAAEAPSFPGAVQTMKRVLPKEERSLGIALIFTGSSIGAMLAAPLATGVLELTHDWRLAFVGTALAGLAWVPLWLAVTRSAGVRQALATAEPEERESSPAPRGVLLVTPAVARAVMLVVFTAPGIMFGLNWSSHYLADTFHLTQAGMARYLMLPPVGFDLGAVVFGALASRADRRAGQLVSHTHLVAVAGALAGAMALAPLASSPLAATLIVSLGMTGGSGIFALLTADMLARVRPTAVSTAGGLTAAAQSLAYIVANPLVGRAVDASHSYALVLVVLGAIVPPAVVAWSVWPMRR
jgi:ACS family hexuronate transporter-like MFS transporter